ncbi:GNAT family N-acetyltransferase [Candidatus Harpocratesius sp.]
MAFNSDFNLNNDFYLTLLERSSMDKFIRVINSNYERIKPFLINPYQHQAYFLTSLWVDKIFQKHKFYYFHSKRCPNDAIGAVTLKKIVDFAYIEYFFIDASRLHRGYGKIMLNLLEKIIRDLNLKKIRLLVHKDAVWAQHAYQKYGFHLLLSDKHQIMEFENGRIAPFFLVNHLLYEKILSD